MSSTQIALKNTVGKVFVRAYNEITGEDKTGDAANITCQTSLDGGAYAASNDTNPTEVDATDDPGLYYFDNTAAEVNGVMSVWRAVSATANIKLSPVDVSVAPNFTDGSTVMDLEQLIIKPSTLNKPAVDLLGNGTGAGIYAVGGTTGAGMDLEGGSSSGSGLKMICGGGSHAFYAHVSGGSGNAINTTVDSGDHLSSGVKANINAEMVDVLTVDTHAQPGQETPAATQTVIKMLSFLYKGWRNKWDQTGAVSNLYNDDAATVDQKQATSYSGSTVTKGEIETGP